MKLSLSLIERITVMGLLPAETNFATLKIVRLFSSEIGFTEDEYTTYEIQAIPSGEGRVSYNWNSKGMTYRADVEFSEPIKDLLKGKLKELDKSDKLTANMADLYEALVNGKIPENMKVKIKDTDPLEDAVNGEEDVEDLPLAG